MTDTILIADISDAPAIRTRTILSELGCDTHLTLCAMEVSAGTRDIRQLQVLLIFIDITQIQDLKSNLSFLGLMIASISHSIKGVLSGLDAGVYTLDKAISRRDENRTNEGLELVKHMAERIRKITLDILFYAKERELNCSIADLRQFADDLIETVRPRFTRLGIQKVFYSTQGIKGTGLGLFIAGKIIRQHGGDIVVESSIGQGSRFCMRLPRKALSAVSPGQQKAVPLSAV